MEKEFVTYEQALALKELGFDEHCFMCYRGKFDLYRKGMGGYLSEMAMERNSDLDKYEINKREQYWISAPLYQQAFRWFREKYKLQAEILWRGDMECFCYKTGKFKYGSHDFSKDDYKTYEEAEQACLDKLIEICKNQ